jgi:glyoxylase-like metal-dependent hydrolase (beta-lactamase superfamily II)
VRHTRVPVPVETGAPGGRTNAHLFGDPAVLVDPAAPDPALDDAVDGRAVDHLVLTHTHPDHAGGVARYAARTGATVWARRGRVDRFVAATGVEPDRTVAGGESIRPSVTALETPGHAPDHLAFETPAGVACGDLAVAEGSVAVAAPEGEMRSYLVSLRRLRARAPDRLHPGHGPPIDDPRATLDRLLAHRRERERRVLAAVRDGATTPDAVVDAAYDADLSGVRELARATVLAHLEKLAVEGRVAWAPRAERVGPA